MKIPFVVELSWTVVDYHRVQRCVRCHPDGWCPRAAVARARILAWRRAVARAPIRQW
ncbi:hypothetical protein O7634_08400 [Micromonospora sp. WMMD1120]|uniref:hypothetical protein n=1 Tax=Micromonospora sp. WMMD1120 TaxID=3016106 RepID=UPI00241711A9|nr:hypothetical protein [Micromonospora sp. WMMD1120]MDG4806772.1 hypothetical protein [Micromonospora sp. WMMD1120]